MGRENQTLQAVVVGLRSLMPGISGVLSSGSCRTTRVASLLFGVSLLGGIASATAFWDQAEQPTPVQRFVLPIERATTDADAVLRKAVTEPMSPSSQDLFSSGSPATQWISSLRVQANISNVTDKTIQFNGQIQKLQEYLLVLGFNLGAARADGLLGLRTEQALEEFKVLYLPITGIQQHPNLNYLVAIVKYFADLATEDHKKYRVNSAILAGIRIASLRTGVEFSYLMELAATESNFNSLVKSAAGSSASGLYQFTSMTWLNTFKAHGEKYGLGEYASQVEFYVNRKGWKRPMVRDATVKAQVLDLRFNPRVAAIMAAELVKANHARLSSQFDRIPGRTELYLTHFLGVDAAISFIKVLNDTPDKIAGEAFPTAARNNRAIFQDRSGKASTINEVYELFDRKFNTVRYQENIPG